MEFINGGKKLTVSKDAVSLNIDGVVHYTTIINYYTETEFKLETKDLKLKYSKNELNVYSSTNEFIENFKFIGLTNSLRVPGMVLVNKFIVKKDFIVSLLASENIFYIGINKDGKETKEKVLQQTNVGNSIVYKSDVNTLHVSNDARSNSKFNGIPVGKYVGVY